MTRNRVVLLLLLLPQLVVAQDGIEFMDKHVLQMLDAEELELTSFGDGDDFAWDADFWAGSDLNRLWIKTKGEVAAGGHDHAELQILTPEAELTAFSMTDTRRSKGSGLGRLELGLRLRYEIQSEFAPYIGLYWVRLRGRTADLATVSGHDADDIEVVAGLRFWY